MDDIQRLNAILVVLRQLDTLPEVKAGLRQVVNRPDNTLLADLMRLVRDATENRS